MSSRQLAYAALFGLLIVVLAVLWATRTPKPRVRPPAPEQWTPAETLAAFIEAQESGDQMVVREFVANEARADFDEMSSGMGRDDLIAMALQFRQEEYKIEEKTDTSATFYSGTSALYLAMTREEGRWRIDPKRTDTLNKESPPMPAAEPSPR